MKFSSFRLWFFAVIGYAVFSFAPCGQAQEAIVYYDMTPLLELDRQDPAQLRRFYDETHLVVSLQGLVNREAPRLYIRYIAAPDDFWWQHLTQPGAWLADRPVQTLTSLPALLAHFKADYQGAVVWDERVPATSNLASTLAGIHNLLPLRYDESPSSLYTELVQGSVTLQVKERLFQSNGSPLFTGEGTIPGTSLASSGSAKCDAYLWLTEHYVKTGKVNPTVEGYYIDAFWLQCWQAGSAVNHTLTNHDYIISHQGLIFDLNVWPDETPVDDRGQQPGTDVGTLKTLFHALYEQTEGKQMIHVAGFTPWAYKYTDYKTNTWNAGGKYGGVPTEWKYAEILSCFNAFMDADAIGYCAMANASFFQHHPVPPTNPQNAKPTLESMKARGFIDADGRIVNKNFYAHYVGDYDAAAWMYHALPRFWTDPKRGEVPLSWAFNPNLCERFPTGMLWTRQTRTPNDFFVAGDSGAGYLNPGLLDGERPHSNLPSGLATWEAHCRFYFDQWDISLTGFVIDGNGPGLSPEELDTYARICPDGIVPQKIPPQGVHKGMPYTRMAADLPHNPAEAAKVIVGGFRNKFPQFKVYRSILQSPTWYASVRDDIQKIDGGSTEGVDLYTLLWLIRYYEEQEKDDPHQTSYAGASHLQSTPSTLAGLEPLPWPDGPFEIKQVKGNLAWVVPAHQPAYYLYVDADDGFCQKHTPAFELQITYLDQNNPPIRIHYDAGESREYRDAGTPQIQTLDGVWKTAIFQIEDARFANSQNGGADFRIYSHGQELRVRAMELRPQASGVKP